MKTITVKDSLDNKYTLQYNRKTVEVMERQGFSLAHLTDKPMTMLPMLFAGAFMMHHKRISQEVVDKIYSELSDKDKLSAALVGMYNETVSVFLDDPEDAEGNATWEASE